MGNRLMFGSDTGICQIKVSDKKIEWEHFHNEIELLYVIQGTTELKIGEEQFVLEKDEMAVINTNEHHSCKSRGECLTAGIFISYRKLCDMLGMRELAFEHELGKTDAGHLQEVRVIVREILNLYVNEKSSYFYGLSLYYRLLDTLVSNFLKEDLYTAKGKNYERNLKINNYIRNNYNKQITLNDLADHLHLSNAYLSRYFKSTYGMSFSEYLCNIRINHAAEDIEYTDKLLLEVALNNGFTNPSAFNKKFRQMYDMTPTEYRQQCRMKKKEQEEEDDDQAMHKLKYLSDEWEQISEYSVLSKTQEVRVDGKGVLEEEIVNPRLINIGAAKELLKSNIREHTEIIKARVGIEYARIWDPFDLIMSVEHKNGTDYNFDQLDEVLEFLLERSIRPFIDLGRKPKRIQRGANDAAVYQENERKAQNIAQWREILTAWMEHLEEEFGTEEVERWYFELWKREEAGPDSDGEYCRLFDTASECIKMYFPEARVGGCGFAPRLDEVRQSLQQMKRLKHLPDFYSLYIFGYELSGEEEHLARRSDDVGLIAKKLDDIRRIIEETKLPERPLIVTEWGLTVSERNGINDTCLKASYMLKNIIRNYGKAQMWGYFVGSDLFSEYSDTKRLLYGSNGLLSKDGILKPSAYALRFIYQLSDKIVYRDESCIITKNRKGKYAILCTNYKRLNYKYYIQEEQDIDVRKEQEYYDDRSVLELKFSLTGMEEGRYRIEIQTITSDSGSVAGEWRRMEYTDKLQKSNLMYLKNVCSPKIYIKTVESINGCLFFNKKLEPQEICFMELVQIN